MANICRLLSLTFLLVVVAASGPASAQDQSATDGPSQQRFFAALRSLSMSDDQRSVIRGIIGDGYLNGQSDREIDGRISAVLDVEQTRTLRNTLGYDPAVGAPPSDFHPRFFAVVHKLAGDAITLTSGRTVFLHDSTSLFPGRDAMKPGVRIGVAGQRTRDGNFNADGVLAFDETASLDFDGTGATAGGRFATIVGATRSSLRLGDGKTVFLRDDTVIVPSRDALGNGAKVVIYGVPTNDGNVNADRVEVVPTN